MSVDIVRLGATTADVTGARPRRVPGGWMLAAIFLLAGIAALAVDVRVAHWCRRHALPGDLQTPINWAEIFGHGTGVAVLLATIWVLDPARRRRIGRLALAAYGAGMAANGAKMLLVRARPRAFELDGGVLESFGRLFPFGAGGSDLQSFPSAHVAVAVGLALALGWLYPKGRWLFFVFAAMVAAQRVTNGAHFCSDALFGAAIGCAIAVLALDVGPLAHWLDRRNV